MQITLELIDELACGLGKIDLDLLRLAPLGDGPNPLEHRAQNNRKYCAYQHKFEQREAALPSSRVLSRGFSLHVGFAH